MRFSVLFLLILVSLSSKGQEFAFEYWHDGKLVLENGDTLVGSIKYDMQTDLVQLQQEEKFETYTARKVLFLEIFDKTIKRYRRMYSLPYAVSGEYKAPVFFELLEEGRVTLLCREAMEYRTFSNSFYYYSSYSRLTIVYKYFLLEENGDIVAFPGNKSDWINLMRDRKDEVQKFARSNRLSYDEKYHIKRIVAYYNSLFAG